MKKVYLYRIIIIFLSILSICFFFLYKNKNCIILKNEIKKVVNPNYVFLGDSITYLYDLDKHYGKQLPIVNSGINGNKTKDILDNLEERVYVYNPSKVILLIGINNFLNEKSSVDDVTNDIEKITSKIRKKFPNLEIYVESIYPINDDWRTKRNRDVPKDSELKEKILLSNKKIEDICKKNKYKYIDIYDKLSDKDGYLDKEYTDDGLHPNEKGYEIITKEIKKNVNFN